MIRKYYKLYCDNCGDLLKEYPEIKPTREELESECFVCTPTKVFCCEQCREEFERENNLSKIVIYTGGREHPLVDEVAKHLMEKGVEVVLSDATNKHAEEHFNVPTLTEEMQKQMYESIKKGMETIGIETEYKSMVEARNRKNNKFNAQQLKNRSRYLNKHPRK